VLSRPTEARGWFARPAAILLGLGIGAVLFVVLFPWFPGGAGMREGDASPWTLSAPFVTVVNGTAHNNTTTRGN